MWWPICLKPWGIDIFLYFCSSMKEELNYRTICFNAMEVMKRASAYIREQHEARGNLNIEVKGEHNFVTEVDKEAEEEEGKVLPDLKGKLDGMALRVPVPNGSVVDLVATVERSTSVDEVNAAMRTAAEGALAGILGYEESLLVSIDYVGDPRSSIVDALCTAVVDGNLVKVVSWYDNEWGYSSRCVDLARRIGEHL